MLLVKVSEQLTVDVLCTCLCCAFFAWSWLCEFTFCLICCKACSATLDSPPPLTTHKTTLNLLARKLRPKMALEDTLWIYYGESRTARVADLRTIIPRHIQRAVGPFTVYAVPHPITA